MIYELGEVGAFWSQIRRLVNDYLPRGHPPLKVRSASTSHIGAEIKYGGQDLNVLIFHHDTPIEKVVADWRTCRQPVEGDGESALDQLLDGVNKS